MPQSRSACKLTVPTECGCRSIPTLVAPSRSSHSAMALRIAPAAPAITQAGRQTTGVQLLRHVDCFTRWLSGRNSSTWCSRARELLCRLFEREVELGSCRRLVVALRSGGLLVAAWAWDMDVGRLDRDNVLADGARGVMSRAKVTCDHCVEVLSVRTPRSG
jgi:hypothetical protein